MIEEKYLREYSYLENNAYLNCCSVAMPPKRTLDFCRGFQDDFTHTLGRKSYGEYECQREAVKKQIAQLIGCSSEEICLTHNTTEGDCLLMRSYAFAPGDSVVFSDFDYPAMVYGWYQLQEQGVRLRKVRAMNGQVRAEDVIAAIDDTTKVVAISQVQYMSGYKTDLEKIGQACNQRRILFVVDAAQGLGRNTIDVKAMHISVLSCCGFKGLLGVLGSGFYYCDSDLVQQLRPNSWSGANIDVSEYGFPEEDHTGVLPYLPGIARLEGGSVNNYGLLALGVSLSLLQEIGIEQIHARVIQLERYYRTKVQELMLPISFLGASEEVFWSGNVCVYFPQQYIPALERALRSNQICATIHDVCGRGFLRIGLHYYNTEQQLERLIKTLIAVLR